MRTHGIIIKAKLARQQAIDAVYYITAASLLHKVWVYFEDAGLNNLVNSNPDHKIWQDLAEHDITDLRAAQEFHETIHVNQGKLSDADWLVEF